MYEISCNDSLESMIFGINRFWRCYTPSLFWKKIGHYLGTHRLIITHFGVKNAVKYAIPQRTVKKEMKKKRKNNKKVLMLVSQPFVLL